MEFRKLNFIPFILIILLIFLQYRLWFEAGGLLDMFRLKNTVKTEQYANEQLKARNQALVQQIQQLQKNQDAVESRARQELGMIKQDEVFYQVVNN